MKKRTSERAVTRPARTPAMREVAAAAGVSIQTVSRVVNGSPRVLAGTASRVREEMTRLGYRPNLAARALAGGRSGLIGIIAPALSDYGPASTLHAVENAVRAAGFAPLPVRCGPTASDLSRADASLVDRAVEGILVLTPLTGSEALGDDRVPVVAIASRGDSPAYIDQRAGVRKMLAHLAALGHSAIRFVAGPPEYVDSEERSAAFSQEMERLGLPATDVLQGDWSARSGYHAADAVDRAATAVFCANDHMALGLVAGLFERGVRVPADVSVVGFDDIPEARYLRPALTTVRQDFERLGRLAVGQLVSRLDGEHVAAARIEPDLVVRLSTAPPRGR